MSDSFSENAAKVATKSVLIIDDDAAMQALMSATLRGIGLRVTLAENGEVGLEKLRTHSFDLVLTDLLMPEMTGLEFLIKVNEEKIPLPPVVVVSSIHEKDIILACLEAGATDYLNKPVSPQTLKELISLLLKITIKQDLRQTMSEMVFGKQSGKVIVTTSAGTGFLRYESGKLKGVTYNDLTGIEALERLKFASVSEIKVQQL
jgi:CheY-like chemotaxis protein